MPDYEISFDDSLVYDEGQWAGVDSNGGKVAFDWGWIDTVTKQTTNIYISGTSCYLSKDGSSSAEVYGGTIIAATFPSYTDDQISAVFGNISVKNSAGRNSSMNGRVCHELRNRLAFH